MRTFGTDHESRLGMAPTGHPMDSAAARSWLADQLLEPTKLVFAIVIAESLRDYSTVLTSPIRHHHYIAALALLGIYLTTVWSWRGWHAAHLTAPYKVDEKGRLAHWEIYRFYADLSIVIAYAYTLFQVDPLLKDPRHNAVWLLIGYPIIVALYGAENWCRVKNYGRSARRLIPLALTFAVHLVLAAIYLVARRKLVHAAGAPDDLLWLNSVTLSAALIVMWGYRHFNEWYKAHYVVPQSAPAGPQ
jgi:hypothetical protein